MKTPSRARAYRPKTSNVYGKRTYKREGDDNPDTWGDQAISRLIVCPDCKAKVGRNCRTSMNHTSRIRVARRQSREAYLLANKWVVQRGCISVDTVIG